MFTLPVIANNKLNKKNLSSSKREMDILGYSHVMKLMAIKMKKPELLV